MIKMMMMMMMMMMILTLMVMMMMMVNIVVQNIKAQMKLLGAPVFVVTLKSSLQNVLLIPKISQDENTKSLGDKWGR